MKNSLKNIKIYFQEYCTHTSVHGFQYFGEKKRHIFERIWWLIVFLACLCGCIVSIYHVYKKWEGSPVIVNFANKGTPIYDIPFPAVTICPESKSDQVKFNFTKVLQKKEDGIELTPSEEISFEYMSLICNYFPELNYTNNKTISDNFLDLVDSIKPDFKFVNCTFIEKSFAKCDDYFTPILTDVGICYTFNMLNRSEIFQDSVIQYQDFHTSNFYSEWSLQNGYEKNAGISPYPYRAYLSGATQGFSLTLVTPKQDLDYACGDSLQGYRVLLHTPMTIPRPSQKFFRIPLDQSVVAGIQPVMITTSKRIKAYDPERRRCYFGSERQLKYFKNYTSSNCNLECLTNATLRYCNCVNFFMPRENETEICGTGSIECMKTAESYLYISQLALKLDKELLKYNDLGDVKADCNCLPVCADLTYNADTSQTDWEWWKKLQARRNLPRVDNRSHLSSLTLFFKSDNFITSERNELYGPIDFLANFGGLLGLFTGFSVLSLMEILYFLTVRIVCNLRLFGHWTGIEN